MRYKRTIVVVVLALVGLGGYYVAGRWSQLSMSLSRSGSNVSPSTSMELYEINLRRMEVDAAGKETGRVLEWKLAVPRAFLLDENGKNGNVYTAKDYDTTRYSFVLAMQVQENLKDFTPRILLKTNSKLPRDILISSSNSVGSSAEFIVINDLCVRQSDQKEAAAKFGVTTIDSNCYEQDYRCGINTQIDGWTIGATVTKEFYSEPEKTCEMTKDFLKYHTIKRDKDTSLFKARTP